MAIIKPATPGFLTTLAATIILAIVSFSVPYFKSVYFLKASLAAEGQSGDITFGTLGYCVILNNTTKCSNATVGYELNINQLVGNDLPIQIPEVVVKWITYALVLHIVALGFAAVSAIFGLLAHVREMAMTCFSSCIAGVGAAVALLAFIFDLAFFFIAKSRLNKVKGGSASFGIAIWLTLAAWILLFFSGCFYGIGRCCIKRRPRKDTPDREAGNGGFGNNGYADQMRLDAVKAEADRKARAKQGEVGLPAFQEYDPAQPLRAKVVDDEVYADEEESSAYHDNTAYRQYNQPPSNTGYAGGYVPGTPGNRAMDEFHSPTSPTNTTYPPRQNSGHTGYEGSQYGAFGAAAAAAAAPVAANQYLSTAPYQGHDQYGSQQEYGHTQGGTTYHSATSHQQYPSAQYDDYNSPPQQPQFDQHNTPPPGNQYYQQPAFNADTYNNTGLLAAAGIAPHPTDHYNSAPYQSPPGSFPQPERNYTLGGGGAYDTAYGTNQVPDHTQHDNQFFPGAYQGQTTGSPHPLSSSPAPINTNVGAMAMPTSTSPVKGPRNMGSPIHQYSDSPPGYEGSGPSQPPGAWGEKR